jgi:hypothetical protein
MPTLQQVSNVSHAETDRRDEELEEAMEEN